MISPYANPPSLEQNSWPPHPGFYNTRRVEHGGDVGLENAGPEVRINLCGISRGGEEMPKCAAQPTAYAQRRQCLL
jgi:hypothetical protein